MSETGVARRDRDPSLAHRNYVGDTAYRDAGAGEAIVFIHGVGLNADAWEPQIAAFETTHRVIAIDMMGHGKSGVSKAVPTLADYAAQIVTVLDAIGVAAANIIGHSMGGLVATAFALAHPARTLRLCVMNSVYRRSEKQRKAVIVRAEEIAASKTVGDIEQPLERWFGPRDQQPATTNDVRHWLTHANAAGYAAAYRLFAESDDVFVGRLSKLIMPTLFATGSLDPNSSPAMTQAMATEVPRGKSLIIDGARHMMNLTHAAEVNTALQEFVKTSAVDSKDLRKAFGTFMTGVTVVTTRDANGELRGFTANSFSSVSLDPPLLLVCISKFAASCETFSTAPVFAVNILSEAQKQTSTVFASKRAGKFAEARYSLSASGNPLLDGSVAWFDCARHNVVDAGDHLVLIGRVTDYAHNDASPLGYARGGYFTLDLEQSAVNAAAQSGRTEVGAILEYKNQLVTFRAPDGKFDLPHVGRNGDVGSASRLLASLAENGIKAHLGFLFAVYENSSDQTQCIVYRGECEAAPSAELLDLNNLPLDLFRDDAIRSMLRRYCAERLEGRYSVYSGDHISGDVREVS